MSQTPTGGAPPPLPPKTPLPAPKKRMHGCLIALIVAAGLLIPIVGILAAIALPAYNDYLGRSKVAQAMGAALPLKWQVVEFHAANERCPGNGDEGFAGGEIPLGQLQAGSTFSDAGEDRCTIELSLRDSQEALDGRRLWFEYDPDDGEWSCRSDLDARYVPTGCGQ